MIYVLNFNDHSFVSVDYPESAIDYVRSLLRRPGVEEDSIEIINAFVDDIRYTFQEFVDAWS